MPEGHTVHRTANAFTKAFAGKTVTIDSPQGRFSASAQLVSGAVLVKALAVGKQLFLGFSNGYFIRIHLGIYGKWAWHRNIGESGILGQPVRGEVRARFYSTDDLAELRGPTVCEVISSEEMDLVLKRLGPDPLNPDPKGEEARRFVERVRRSKQTIGQLLMDQSVISGIGNVYRAEILFRAGIEPCTPGNLVTEEQLLAIWDDAVALMKVGVKTGFMITRDELFTKRPTKAERNFVYKREGEPCRVCGTKVSIAIMATRKLYWCAGCQR